MDYGKSARWSLDSGAGNSLLNVSIAQLRERLHLHRCDGCERTAASPRQGTVSQGALKRFGVESF